MPKKQKHKQTLNKTKIRLPRMDFEISYKSYAELAFFVNDRGRILARKRTGLSAKEQRAIAREIKRARHLGLLPYKGMI